MPKYLVAVTVYYEVDAADDSDALADAERMAGRGDIPYDFDDAQVVDEMIPEPPDDDQVDYEWDY